MDYSRDRAEVHFEACFDSLYVIVFPVEMLCLYWPCTNANLNWTNVGQFLLCRITGYGKLVPNTYNVDSFGVFQNVPGSILVIGVICKLLRKRTMCF